MSPKIKKLPLIFCPGCKQPVYSREYTPNRKGGANTASAYDTCLRQCGACGYGFSNANTDQIEKLTIIYRDPFRNVPSSIADGWETTLGRALNRANRAAKRVKFASSNSEDHVTWTVFRYLQLQKEIRPVLSNLGSEISKNAIDEPAMLLWGVPVPPNDPKAQFLQGHLVRILETLGESPRFYSEPDVILEFGEKGVIFIEMKVGSPNDKKQPSYGGWERYIKDKVVFGDTRKLKECGLYELARNWRIA